MRAATAAYNRQVLHAARLNVTIAVASIEARASEPQVIWARRVLRSGHPRLIFAVEEGRIALYLAAKVAALPIEQQMDFFTSWAASVSANLPRDEHAQDADVEANPCRVIPRS